MNSVALLSKRHDLTPTEFRDYYEGVHCLKAMKYFPYRQYARNYPVDAASLGFDCVSEFELELEGQPSGVAYSGSRQKLVEDERHFMQPDLVRFASIRERLVYADAKGALMQGATATSAGQCRQLLLFRRAQADDDFEQQLTTSVQGLMKSMVGASSSCLDLIDQHPKRPFPFDALLWLRQPADAAVVTSIKSLPRCVAMTAVTTHISSEQEMKARFSGYIS